MADILIKDIEMPKCCDECPMSQLINDNQYAYCNLLRKGIKAGYILKACPLVELPPHGELKDVDKLLLRIDFGCCGGCHGKDVEGGCAGCSTRAVINEIKDTCTVLEANNGADS